MQRVDSDETTVQLAGSAAGHQTMVRFHRERMRDAEEREAQRAHQLGTLDRLAAALGGATSRSQG